MPLGFLGSVVNSVIGANSQSKTNETNMRINQMNNQFNKEMAEQAFARETAYNDRIRAEDRQYNSASAQAERYRQAGLNPGLMMQGQSAGVAQSNGVSGGAASAAPSHAMGSYTPNIQGGGVSAAITNFLQYKSEQQYKQALTQGIYIENQYKAAEAMSRIANNMTGSMANRAKARLDSTVESLQHSIFDQNKRESDQRIEESKTRAALNSAKEAYTNKELSIFEQKFKLDCKEQVARTLMYAANANLSAQQAEHEVYKALMTQAQTTGQKISNHVARSTAQSVIRTAYINEAKAKQPQNMYQAAYEGLEGMAKAGSDAYEWGKSKLNKHIIKPSKKAWKDTRRSFGF